jgi:hypothetical protein
MELVMARIRSVHPPLFTDEAFVSRSMPARLLAIGLWTEADDRGVFEWKPMSLKMRLFPADNLNLADLLAELLDGQIIAKHVVDGKDYGIIRNFCKWQRPKKPTYRYPFESEWAKYVGFKLKKRPTGAQHVLHQFSTEGEISAQMKEGEEEGEEEGEKEEGDNRLSSGGHDARDGVSVDLDSDNSPEMVKAISRAIAPRHFEEFWQVYPKRAGANPKQPARKQFISIVGRGQDAAIIIASARAYADELRREGKFGTAYVAQAQTWLGQQRWSDYEPSAADIARREEQDRDMLKRGMKWIDGRWRELPSDV